MILSLLDEEETLKQYVDENHLSWDESKSAVENANMFFKKYKKSKRTMEMAKLEIEKAKDEIEYLSYLLASSKYMNDDELLALSQELLPKQSQKKKIATIKYGTLIFDNVKILYGKNASSNNELTFKVATKDDWYLHIKDYHGAHIIIRHPNPSNKVKLVAAELCLILLTKKLAK